MNNLNPQQHINQYQWPYDQTTAVPGSGRLDTILKQYPAPSNMKSKFDKIAELFELDVLSEEDALKACKTVIQQHAKVKGKTGKDSQ